MNTRERLLAFIALGALIALGGGWLVLQFLIVPLRDRDAAISLLQRDVAAKRDEVLRIQAERAKLERWRQISLPADSDLARREYEKFLSDLLRQSKFAPGMSSVTPKPADSRSSPTLPGKKEPIYTKLSFNVVTHGELSSLVTFLERFYHTGLLHQIKNLSIQRPLTTGQNQKPTGLDINLTVEALVLAGVDNRPYLAPIDQRLLVLNTVSTMRHGPSGLALVPIATGPAGPLGNRPLAASARQYASILDKNIFFGPPPAAPIVDKGPPPDRTDVTQFVHLTDIARPPTQAALKLSPKATAEAHLYDRYNDKKMRLLDTVGYDSLLVPDAQGNSLVSGKIVRIDDRDVIFKANDKYYAFHVGQSLKEAMVKPLKEEELKEWGILPGDLEKLPPPKETTAKPEPGSN